MRTWSVHPHFNACILAFVTLQGVKVLSCEADQWISCSKSYNWWKRIEVDLLSQGLLCDAALYCALYKWSFHCCIWSWHILQRPFGKGILLGYVKDEFLLALFKSQVTTWKELQTFIHGRVLLQEAVCGTACMWVIVWGMWVIVWGMRAGLGGSLDALSYSERQALGIAIGLNNVLCSTARTCVCQGLRRGRSDFLE